MKLEKQVTNLKLSKKLKKLGVKQESLFYWTLVADAEGEQYLINRSKYKDNSVSAFTVAELGEMLPKSIIVKDIEYWLQIEVQGVQDGWSCQYKNNGAVVRQVIVFFEEKTMADTGAKMLIYLIEQKILKAGEQK